MTVTTKTKADLVTGQVTTVQAQASGLVDASEGSILLALAEAFADVVLWLQGLILTLLATIRAATSTGADLDSWMADYGLARLAATYGAGNLTFGRLSGSGSATVPVGSTVQSADGSQKYVVTLDATNAHYDAGLVGYVMGSTVLTVTVPAVALAPGSGGNAVAGAITVITSPIPGVDTVTNGSGFTGGADAETDAAFRARFVLYLQSLAEGTLAAIGAAITGVQAGVSYTLIENVNYAGSPLRGNLVVVADDGSGSPGDPFLDLVELAVEGSRPAGMTYEVHAPMLESATIVLVITVAAGYTAAAICTAVQTAITAYVASLTLGQGLAYTRLIQVAYDTSPAVTNVSGLTINSATADLTATNLQVIRTSSVTVTHT